MMPLSMVNEGEPQVIKKVGGKEETRKFLENLGNPEKRSKYYENITASWRRSDCHSEETARRRTSKETYHGYGNHQRGTDLCT